jgi:hypothetical protein
MEIIKNTLFEQPAWLLVLDGISIVLILVWTIRGVVKTRKKKKPSLPRPVRVTDSLDEKEKPTWKQ